MLRSRLILEWVLVALFGIVTAASLAYFGATEKLDNLIFDVVSPLRAAPPSDRILIVEIDNDSLKEIGKWPWGRDVHAQFLTALKLHKPAAVAFDVLFLEPGLQRDDDALADAVARGAPTFLPVLYEVPGKDGASDTLTMPIAPLRAAAAGLGEVNLLIDGDGLVRRAQLETQTNAGAVPHLMEQVFRRVSGRSSAAHQRLVRGDGAVDGALLVPMAKVGAFRRISYANVRRGDVPASFLRDKIILVGATADGSGDRYAVSAAAGSTMSGIEIQANLLNALLADRFITPVPKYLAALVSMVPVLVLMLAFWRFRPGASLALTLTLIVAIFSAATLALTIGGIWFAPTAALIGLALVYPLWSWRRLEALSGFVSAQSRHLRDKSGDPASATKSLKSLDVIGQQAVELQSVIGELNDRKQFMTDVIAGLPDPVCVLDQNGLVTLANAAALTLFGPNVGGSPMQSLLLKAGAGGISDGEEVTLANGGSYLLRSVTLGDRPGSITMLADISALRELTQEREEMLEFLSHDMRSPQSAILMLLSGSEASGVDPSMRERISDYANKTLRLADDFVQLARLKAIDLAQDDVDIAGVFNEAIDMAWTHANAHGVKIVRTGLETEVFVKGDAGALFRALSNLIDNAIKYGSALNQVHCGLSFDRKSGTQRVTLSISDNGPGLPPERAKNIFERFGDRGSTAQPGTGLGLAFVRTVVTRHGGEIMCDSHAGKGTCFTLIFPTVDFD